MVSRKAAKQELDHAAEIALIDSFGDALARLQHVSQGTGLDELLANIIRIYQDLVRDGQVDLMRLAQFGVIQAPEGSPKEEIVEIKDRITNVEAALNFVISLERLVHHFSVSRLTATLFPTRKDPP